MRPRVFPAEDTEGRVSVGVALVASMRPRVFPAEDGEIRVHPDGTTDALQ